MRKAPPLGLVLDSSAPDPLHRQIGAELRRAILERRMPAGTPLPSSRLMAAELACARGTVLAALEQLVAEGYVVTRPGAGLSVAADLPDAMPEASRPGAPPSRPNPAAPAVDPAALRVGQPDFGAFPFRLWAKLLDAEWRRPGPDAVGTGHPFGHAGLRAAIAAHLGMMRGFRCDPAAVVVTSGIRQGVALLARLVLQPGDAAWVEEPGFSGIRDALRAAGARPVPVPIDGSGFSPERAKALAPTARLAVVAPGHHYPLGTVPSLPRRLALLAWAEQAGGWVLEDDFDGEYRYSGRPLAPLRALDRSGRVAFAGSFSKLLFPALPGGASLLGQGALGRFIAEGHFAAHLRRTRRLYKERQAVLVEAAHRHLAGVLDVPPDPGGMHLVARPHPSVAAGFDERRVLAAAAVANVAPAGLAACFAGQASQAGRLLGYAGTPTPGIEPAVRRLRDAVLSRSPGRRSSPAKEYHDGPRPGPPAP